MPIAKSQMLKYKCQMVSYFWKYAGEKDLTNIMPVPISVIGQAQMLGWSRSDFET